MKKFLKLLYSLSLVSLLVLGGNFALGQSKFSTNGAEVAYPLPTSAISNTNCAWAYALKIPCVLASSGAVVTNTAIGTSEVNMVSVAYPALAANDSLRITTLWDTAGTATNTKVINIRLATSSCTPLNTCSSGSNVFVVTFNSASILSNTNIAIVRNANATNAQVMEATGVLSGVGSSGTTNGSTAVQTNAGGFINIDSITSTSSSDSVILRGYTIELIPGA